MICNHHLATGGIKSKLVKERERGLGNARGGVKLLYLPTIAGLFEERLNQSSHDEVKAWKNLVMV